jgi:thiamine biosynthesis lipoprotein
MMLRLLVIVVAAAPIAGGCASPAPEASSVTGAPVERAHVTMGSELRLTAWTADERRALDAFAAVFAEFDRLDAAMSVWKDGSDIVRLNQAAGVSPVKVGRDTRAVLRTAQQVGDWTGGKFDVTFGALSDLWKFDHDQDNRIPASADVRARLPLVDYSALAIDDLAGTAYLRRKGMRAHLGGIGKGYAVDQAVRLMRARGLTDFMIQSGGDMYVAGRRGDRPWRIGIRDPRGADGTAFASINLTDVAISTSGDYERYFIENGRRYHHILDPDTGQPAASTRSVTIVARRSMFADALATAVFVAGPQTGLKLLDRLEGVEAVIVTVANDVLVTPGLRGQLEMQAPPTAGP